MKKAEAKTILDTLKAHIESTKKRVGYYFPEMVYTKNQSQVLKAMRTKWQTASQVAKKIESPITTVDPMVKRFEKAGVVESRVVVDEKPKGKKKREYKMIKVIE